MDGMNRSQMFCQSDPGDETPEPVKTKATARINGSILCGKCNYAMLPRMRGGKHIISCIMTGCSEFEVYYKEPTVNLELELEPIEVQRQPDAPSYVDI